VLIAIAEHLLWWKPLYNLCEDLADTELPTIIGSHSDSENNINIDVKL